MHIYVYVNFYCSCEKNNEHYYYSSQILFNLSNSPVITSH